MRRFISPRRLALFAAFFACFLAGTLLAQSLDADWFALRAKYLQGSRDEHNHHIKEWKQAAAYDFSDGKLPDSFKVFDGNWEVIDGKLTAKSGKKDGNRVIKIANCQYPAFKLEFDASLSPNPGDPADKISDIGVLLNASDSDGNFREGYGILAGTYGNQASVFYRLYIPHARTEWSPIVPGKTHHITLEVVKPHFRYWIDGKVVIDFWERTGKKGIDNTDFMEMDPTKAMNLYTYDSVLQIDNLKISVPNDPPAKK